MATSEEKQQLVDALSGPQFYRIVLNGYGGEAAYLELTEEQYEFWTEKNNEDSSATLDYMLGCEDDGAPEWVPAEMDFLADEDADGDTHYSPWYDAPTEFCHQYGVAYESARVTVEQLDIKTINESSYDSRIKKTILEGENLEPFLDNVMEESDWELELVDMEISPGTEDSPECILQFYSSEKGTFFDGVVETVGEFDPRKLKIITHEYPNGEDTVSEVWYDGVEVVNEGGDTIGKGYSVHIWKN